jgi:hypothetical protein
MCRGALRPYGVTGRTSYSHSVVVEREVQADEADIISVLSASLRTQLACLMGVSTKLVSGRQWCLNASRQTNLYASNVGDCWAAR